MDILGAPVFTPCFVSINLGTVKGHCYGPADLHSADRWRELLDPIVQRYAQAPIRKYFRGDAAFAKPELYTYLEAHQCLYAIRLSANDILYEQIPHLLTRPVGRPPKKPIVW